MGKKVTSFSVDEDKWKQFESRVADYREIITNALNRPILFCPDSKKTIMGA